MKRKWPVVVLISLAVIAGGIFLYLRFAGSKDFEPLIKKKLQQIVSEGSDGLYTLELEHIQVDVINSKVSVQNVSLNVDSARLKALDSMQEAPDDIYKVSVTNLVIDGIGPDDLLKKRSIDLDLLYVKKPVVEIFHHKRPYNYTPPDTTSLYKKIANEIGHFSLKALRVQDVDFSYNNVQETVKTTRFKNVNIGFDNILIDSTTQHDSSRFLYATNAAITLHDYSLITKDSLYNFHIDSFKLNAGQRLLKLNGITLKPRGGNESFTSKLKYYKDRYNVSIESAVLENIDWWQLLAEESFSARSLTLENGDVNVYGDRRLPEDGRSKVGNYPHQLLMKIDMPVYLQTISAKNFDVRYTEISKTTEEEGYITFNNINASFSNVTNKKEVVQVNPYMQLEADAAVMNKGLLHASFKFDLAHAESGRFWLDAVMKSMDGTALNKATKPLGLFEVKSADIDKILIQMTATNSQSNGSISFFYKDLDVSILKKDGDELKKRGLISFLANSFVIKKSNTDSDSNKDPKVVTQKRAPERSFFNLIWKTIFAGIRDTIK